MMAAGRAAERGRRVLLLEKNPAPGKKLLITGGGRCNVTNNKPDARVMLAKYGDDGKFLFSAFAQFGVAEALSFFNTLGVATKEEAEGRVFPVSNKAKSVWEALVRFMKRGGVTVRTGATVTGVAHDRARSEMVITLEGGSSVRARSCVVATGGTSHPETGSTGEGFLWLKKLGHTVAENDLALVPIALKDAWTKKLSGVTLQNIKFTTFKNGLKQKVYNGKLLFTHFGISGPTVLNMSRDVGELLHDREGFEYTKKDEGPVSARPAEVTIVADLFPDLDGGTLREKLQALLVKESNKKIKNVLSGFIASALSAPLLTLAGIDGEMSCHSVRSEERRALLLVMKAIPLRVAGLLDKDKAVVSSGGVALSMVNFKTMESRLVPGLYLAGDVLNVNRPSGGYSLQLCWTTGFVAGSNC